MAFEMPAIVAVLRPEGKGEQVKRLATEILVGW
jgi:hypothetical protein